MKIWLIPEIKFVQMVKEKRSPLLVGPELTLDCVRLSGRFKEAVSSIER